MSYHLTPAVSPPPGVSHVIVDEVHERDINSRFFTDSLERDR